MRYGDNNSSIDTLAKAQFTKNPVVEKFSETYEASPSGALNAQIAISGQFISHVPQAIHFSSLTASITWPPLSFYDQTFVKLPLVHR
jgi:hypothetical protein